MFIVFIKIQSITLIEYHFMKYYVSFGRNKKLTLFKLSYSKKTNVEAAKGNIIPALKIISGPGIILFLVMRATDMASTSGELVRR